MEVNDALIDNLSNLACLEFNAAEKEGIKKDLQRMVSFVEKLNELDIKGTEPLMQMSDEVNVFRDDTIEVSTSRTEAFKNAPLSDDLYFKVPKVIKNLSA
ncbi:MAG: Asp-tRNA(Asn)/Glu-tRNA(Gln) amidotransferase subunit GatC [Bacteroidetes bacterium]|nr:Asp-tRNA(Asn)/Glu-tRNA(Gln) amidotransferase subunit GatC [Bacteroidota bacterium]